MSITKTEKTELTTTLALLKEHYACQNGYKTLLASLPANYPQDKPINLLHILKSNGVQDMMWALRATTQDRPKVRVAICADMAARVLKHFEAKHPNDKRPREAIKACRLFVRGKISIEVLRKAAYATYAAYAAYAAALEKECAAQARIIRKYLC